MTTAGCSTLKESNGKEILTMKGYYSLGLSGYEVDIIDQDHVRWLFVDRKSVV